MSANSESEARSTADSRDNVIGTLINDHEELKKACRRFEQLQLAGNSEEAGRLVQRACAELTVHAKLEEELIYPEARRVDALEDLVTEAEVEHASAKMLIADIGEMKPSDPKWKASFTVLCEYVKHHIKEEEQELFPKLQKVKIDWVRMAEDFRAMRLKLHKTYGLGDDPET